MMAKLADALSALTPCGDLHIIEAPEAWTQGRTLYGGMTAALCFEAAKRQLQVEAPLRSAQFTFVGPASGELTFRADLLRAGRSSTVATVDCASGSGLAARGAFVFGADRSSLVENSIFPPSPLPVAEDCPVFIGPTGGFHDNFELRLAAGSPLFSGDRPSFTVWVRFLDPPGVDATTALLAIADALPPAAMARFETFAPISTATWTMDVANVPSSLNGWHLLHSESDHSANGYSMQTMALWRDSGTLLATGRQAVAIFA
jgi:acyl-CoA thioesterase